jgi:thiol-disulfide isomerase/thioredoxin
MESKPSPARRAWQEKAQKRRRQERIRSLVIFIGAALVLTAVLLLIITHPATQSVTPARVGSSLSQFTLKDINGKQVSLSDYSGSVVLVNAWATWCPPCKAEMPLLESYYQAHSGQGFVILAIDAGDTQDVVASFATQYGLPFPVLLDPGMQLLSGLGINSFPTSILVGRDGKVKTIHFGIFTKDSIDAEISPLL